MEDVEARFVIVARRWGNDPCSNALGLETSVLTHAQPNRNMD
jgi:hypothetical protein